MGNRLWQWIQRAMLPSGSRWGISAFLLAIAFFLYEGSGMLELIVAGYPLWRLIMFGFGCFFFISALALGIKWLVESTPKKEESVGDINKSIRDQMLKIKMRKGR